MQGDKTATGIRVPDEVIAARGPGRRPPVRVTVNGYTYRTTVASMKGAFMFSVSADVRKNAGVSGGDEVDVDIELDNEPREVAVPADLQAALGAGPEAVCVLRFIVLQPQVRLRALDRFRQEGRDPRRRIPEAVGMLKEGRKQR